MNKAYVPWQNKNYLLIAMNFFKKHRFVWKLKQKCLFSSYSTISKNIFDRFTSLIIYSASTSLLLSDPSIREINQADFARNEWTSEFLLRKRFAQQNHHIQIDKCKLVSLTRFCLRRRESKTRITVKGFSKKENDRLTNKACSHVFPDGRKKIKCWEERK